VGWEKITTYLQFAGAALAIPVAAAGTYTVYQTHFTTDVTCQKLRTSIVATLERNVAPDLKRTLLRKEVAEFSKNCAAVDPDAKALFEAAMQDTPPALAAVPSQAPAATAATPVAALDGLPVSAVAAFGRSASGEVRGWVALTRGESNRIGEPNFDGFGLSLTVLPPSGTILRPRQVLPVWLEPQYGDNDGTKLQGRVPAGICVRVVATQAARGKTRTWGDVVPLPCPTHFKSEATKRP